jgi:hypothetical protein
MDTTTRPPLLANDEDDDALLICGDGIPQPKDLSPEDLQRTLQEECAPAGDAAPTPELEALFAQRRLNRTRSRVGK